MPRDQSAHDGTVASDRYLAMLVDVGAHVRDDAGSWMVNKFAPDLYKEMVGESVRHIGGD